MTCIREDNSKLKNETIGGGAPPAKNSTDATLTPKKEQVTEKVKEEPILSTSAIIGVSISAAVMLIAIIVIIAVCKICKHKRNQVRVAGTPAENQISNPHRSSN